MWHAFTWSWKTPCARFQKPVFRKPLFTGFGSVTAPARQGSPDPPERRLAGLRWRNFSLLKTTTKIGKPDERFSPITPQRYVLATCNRPPSHIIRPPAFQRYQPRVCATYGSRDTGKMKFFSAISPERKLVQTNRRHRWKARPVLWGDRAYFHLSTTFLSKVIPSQNNVTPSQTSLYLANPNPRLRHLTHLFDTWTGPFY